MTRAWTRTYTHQKAQLDIRELQSGRSGRSNLLKPGTKIFSHQLDSGRSVSMRVRPDYVEVEYQVEVEGRMVPRSIRIQFAFSQCKLGGARAWWLCPCCSKRVAVLYGWGRFHCRKCADLHYHSQSESEEDRTLRRAGKLRKRLGWRPGIINPQGGKPRGMHWRTYHQLLARYNNEKAKALTDLGASLRRLTDGGMRVSMMPGIKATPKFKVATVKAKAQTKLRSVKVPQREWPVDNDLSLVAALMTQGAVQCRDCANLSAGFKCLAPGSGQLYPAMGEWRHCAKFVKLEMC